MRRPTTLHAAPLFFLAMAFVAAPAVAQTSTEAEAEAKAAMKRGLSAFARRDAETALAEYKKAERLVPDANVPHRYAAEALVELDRYEEALQEYETYLRIKPDVSDAAEVQKRIENVRARLEGTIDLRSSPSGASVFVDGSSTKAGVTPLTGLKLRRGSHTILLQLSGHKDVVLSPVVRGGEPLALSASFGDGSSIPSSRDDGAAPVGGGRTTNPVGWIVLGSGALVLAGAFAVDALLTSSAFDTFEEKRRVDDPGAGDALSSARTLQTVSIVGYAVGGALAATGLVVVLWPKKNATVKASAGLGGVALSGRF